MKKKILIYCLSLATAFCAAFGLAKVTTFAADGETGFYSVNGASIRVIKQDDADYSGIRFKFEMTKSFYDGIVTDGKFNDGVTVKAYLIPTELAEEVTAESIISGDKAIVTDLPVEKWLEKNSEVTSGTQVYATYVHLYNVPATAYDKDISAFARIVSGENVYTTEIQTRSLQTVAVKAVDADPANFAEVKNYLPDEKVTFVTDDGKTTESKVKYGESVAAIDNPEKTGYLFNGWTAEDGSLYDFSDVVKNDTVLTAKYVKIPTAEELQEGYTFSMSDYPVLTNEQWLSGGNGAYARNVNFVDRPDFITDTTNFGEKVLKITEKGYCAKFDFLNDVLREGRTYKLTFSLYVKKGNSIAFSHKDTVKSNIFAEGYTATNAQWNLGGSWKWTYSGTDDVFMISNGHAEACEMYLGNITVTEDFYKPTEDELKNGYTFKINSALEFSKPKYGTPAVRCEQTSDELKTNGFGEKAVYATGNGHSASGVGIKFLENILETGKQYKITFRIACRSIDAKDNIYYTGGDGKAIIYCYPGNTWFYATLDKTFTPSETYKYPMLGSNQPFEMYLGDVTITLID